MNQQGTSESSTDPLDAKLQLLRDQIKKMEQENTKIFEELGVSPHQLQELLSDKHNFSSTQVFDIIQKQRDVLVATLTRRIDEIRSPSKQLPNRHNIGARGHWIFVR